MSICYHCGQLIKSLDMYRGIRVMREGHVPVHAGCKRKYSPDKNLIGNQNRARRFNFHYCRNLCGHVTKIPCAGIHDGWANNQAYTCPDCGEISGLYFQPDAWTVEWRLYYQRQSIMRHKGKSGDKIPSFDEWRDKIKEKKKKLGKRLH